MRIQEAKHKVEKKCTISFLCSAASGRANLTVAQKPEFSHFMKLFVADISDTEVIEIM